MLLIRFLLQVVPGAADNTLRNSTHDNCVRGETCANVLERCFLT